jgi:hypothetical protein
MVTTERSAPSDWEARPSILAQLRAWSAKHPLRPDCGSPPALCDPDEIPIVWARHADGTNQRDLGRIPLRWTEHAARRIHGFGQDGHEPEVEAAAADAVVATMGGLQDVLVRQEAESPAAVDAPEVREALAACYQASLETGAATLPHIADRLRASTIQVRTGKLLARWMLAQARHGEAIKLAIALLRLTDDRTRADDLSILGRHAELWSSAVNALYQFGIDGMDLAWGRLATAGCCARRHLLHEMASLLDRRPDIRLWIVRHGHRSWPGDPLLREQERASGGKLVDEPFTPCVAAACAVAGDLAGVLADPEIDDDLLDAACGIVRDLFADMGEADLEACPDGVLIVDRLVGHLLDRCDTLARLLCVKQIHAWLEWPPESLQSDDRAWNFETPDDEWLAAHARAWTRREVLGWTEEIRADLADDCQRILRRPHWPDRVRSAFATYEPRYPDDPSRGRDGARAMAVAPAVGVDLLDDGLRMLERYPLDRHLTAWLVQTRNAERVERVIRLAERLLPRALREASDAGDAGPAGAAVGRRPVVGPLTFLLQAMRKHQIYSERLVMLALRHQGRERRLAAELLEGRPPGEWNEEVVAALRSASGDEPDEEMRARLRALLARPA